MHESHLVWVVVLLKAFFKQASLRLGEPSAFTPLGCWPTVDNLRVFFSLFLHVVGDLCIYLRSAASHGWEVGHVLKGELPRVLDVGPLITICAFRADYNNQSSFIQQIYDVDVLIYRTLSSTTS
jgi:hypothetical protein